MEKYLKAKLAADPNIDTGLLVVGLAEHLMAAKDQRTRWGWTMKSDGTPHPICQQDQHGEALAKSVIDHISAKAVSIVEEACKKSLKGENWEKFDGLD